MRSVQNTVVLGALLLLWLGASVLWADDWPMQARDARRSNITGETLGVPLRRAWTHACSQPPAPAWPAPVKNLNRLDFDYAAQPVVSDGLVCFGSSADDTVRALDLETGRERWHFTTGGPVRFAPQIHGGKVYVASDDGQVYCLAAATGKVVWTFRPVEQDERLIGNGRMISRWPIRTGVLVDSGTVYFIAGMWPSEGIYVYALDALTGEVVWINDTSGAELVIVGHVVSTVSGVNPQGALLATDDLLVVPMGRSAPATYDRHTGELLKYHPGLLNGIGGSWITIDGDRCYLYSKSFYSPLALAALDLTTLEVAKEGGRVRVPDHSDFVSQWQYSLYSGKTSVLVANGTPVARSAYALAQAGPHLVLGLHNAVAIEDSGTGERLWQAEVKGKVYGLAVADGRLIVSTDQGEVACFVSASAQTGSEKPSSGVGNSGPKTAPTVSAVDESVLRQLREAGMDRGYALVVGDPDGRLSQMLAVRTTLHVINALSDPESVHRLRERLLAETALYGSRIHVQRVSGLDHLPFAHYFANAVIVAGDAPGMSGRELTRVLRPHGGMLLFPGLGRDRALALARDSGALAEELRNEGGVPWIVRGRLDGAWDWDSAASGDLCVKWPLRPIWFGEPGSDRVFNRKVRGQSLAAAGGRFFINGDAALTAIDAYNGFEWWTKPLPFSPRGNNATVSADDRYVYFTLGKSFFQDKAAGCMLLDVVTGEQKAIYAPYTSAGQASLAEPRTWPLHAGAQDPARETGTVTLARDGDGLVFRLTTDLAPADSTKDWSLFLDFRPRDRRFGLYEAGVYHYRVFPDREDETPASWRPGAGGGYPPLAVSGVREAGRSVTTARLRWADIDVLAGGEPTSFGFAASLAARPVATVELSVLPVATEQSHLFCDGSADGLNNGWATVFVDPGDVPEGELLPPTIVCGLLEGSMPDAAEALTILPADKWKQERHRLVSSLTPRTRIHPLTGRTVELTWLRPFGCGSLTVSAVAALTRGGTLAIYDYVDDSGLRNFGGVRHSCGVSSMAANGVWFASDGGAGCECTYNFLTSVTLAPAERRLNEDWAMFADWPADFLVRQGAFNMAAPGDRRDADGRLWLGIPRLETEKSATVTMGNFSWQQINGVWQQSLPMSMPVPLELDGMEGFGPYRVNADRVSIGGTERPWLYASGYRGLRKATVKLDPLPRLCARRNAGTVTIDGGLDEAVWQGDPAVLLPSTESPVFFSYDDQNLYIAARRPPAIDRKGKVRAWATKYTGHDIPQSYFGDFWECFLSDRDNEEVLHLALTAGGGRLDGLAEGGGNESLRWGGDWSGSVRADDTAFQAEFAVPWSTIEGVGLDRASLAVNVLVGRHPKVGEGIVRLGARGRERCDGFVPLGLDTPPEALPRLYTVRLHFAELDRSVPVGRRVFDVLLQGRPVLKGLDIVQAAGGACRALVREFEHVSAGAELVIEFVPVREGTAAGAAPLISAIEFVDESLAD